MFADSTQHTLTNHTHGSTFGGNPICTAGGISIIDRLDDASWKKSGKKGNTLKKNWNSANTSTTYPAWAS